MFSIIKIIFVINVVLFSISFIRAYFTESWPNDNDTLGAIVAVSMKADLLVLLSDIDGLYTADPHKDENAELISVVKEITPEIEALGGGKGSSLGTGGMVTKLNAAEVATAAGIHMIITNGNDIFNLYNILEGEPVGTLFVSKNFCDKGDSI